MLTALIDAVRHLRETWEYEAGRSIRGLINHSHSYNFRCSVGGCQYRIFVRGSKEDVEMIRKHTWEHARGSYHP